MLHTHLPVCLALASASAVAFGLASALQHRESRRTAQRGPLDPALLRALGARPLWLLGLCADVAAVALQALALRYGPVAVVQPVLLAGLPAAVLLSAALEHVRVSGRQAQGVALSVGGLALLLPVLTTVGRAGPAGRPAALVAAAVLVAVTGVLLAVARRRPRLAAAALGAAAGMSAGTASVLLSVCVGRAGDPVALARSLAPWATVLAGLLALLLSQAAFQTGALGAPLATLSVVEPVTAVALAVAVLHERVSLSTAAVAATGLACALCVAGVVRLSWGDGTPVPAGAGGSTSS